LPPSLFKHLENLLDKIRAVKKGDVVEPRLSSEFRFCPLEGECRSLVFERGGLSQIFGIAEIREEQ